MNMKLFPLSAGNVGKTYKAIERMPHASAVFKGVDFFAKEQGKGRSLGSKPS